MKVGLTNPAYWKSQWRNLQNFTDNYFVSLETERPLPYLVSGLIIVVAVYLNLQIPLFHTHHELLLLCSIVFSAWYGGLGSSLFTLAMSALALEYFFLTPTGQFDFIVSDLPILFVFILIGLMVTALVATQRRGTQLLSHFALHDHLTGLPNRRLFEDRLESAIKMAQRSRNKVAVIFIDLDFFKIINDTLGHKVGDKTIKAIAKELRSTVRQVDTVSRWGGDEFVILLPDIDSQDDAMTAATKLLHKFRKPFVVDDYEIDITTSMGIAVYPNDGADKNELIKNADQALYKAKHAGRNQFLLHSK